VNPAECTMGGFNSVYFLDKDLVLRTTAESQDTNSEQELQQEGALMRVLARAGIHPAVFAQTPAGNAHAPFGYRGSAFSSLMQREVSLRDFLTQSKYDDFAHLVPTLEATLFKAVCKTADLGLCLLDIRPNNVVCLLPSGVCHLIDLGSDYLVWMDEKLLDLFREDEQNQRRRRSVFRAAAPARLGGSACAKTRGVQLYLMLLLMHRHLELGSQRYARYNEMASLLRKRLADSCVPLDRLRELFPRKCPLHEEGLGEILACRLKQYFAENQDTFLRDYVLKHRLMREGCSGKALDVVVVAGRDYSRDDAASCQGTRASVLRRLGSRTYPCVERLPSLQYSVDDVGSASQLVQRPRKASSITPIITSELTLDYGTELSRCAQERQAEDRARAQRRR
jgi:hypothetical protein